MNNFTVLALLTALSFTLNAHANSTLTLELSELEKQYPEEKYQMVELSDGLTHYQDLGSKTAPVIILVHGVSGPLQVWDKAVHGLQDAGYRVVRYDIYGRGFSERLDGPYDLDLYIRQLHQLAVHLGIERFRVVGSSMGAIIASQYANRFPEHVDQLVLIGPAGFPIEVPRLAKLRNVPILGQLTFSAFGESIIFEQNKKYFVHPERYSEFLKFFRKQLHVTGSSDAILSTMRNVPVTDFESGYRNLASKSKPVAVLWGREDATFPYHNYNLLKKWIPHAQMLTIDDAAHLPQYEQPQEVLDAMLNFFADKETWHEDLNLNQKGEINRVSEIEPIGNGALFDSDFFQQFDGLATQAIMDIGDGSQKQYEFPTRYSGVTFAAAIFLADYDKVVSNIGDDSLHPISLGFNRTILVLSSYRYNQVKGLPAYNEVAISVPVKRRKESQSISSFLATLNEYEMRILRMPVTSKENLLRGRYFWGINKTLEAIDLSTEDRIYKTQVFNTEGERHFTWEVPMDGQKKDASRRISLALTDQNASSAISEVKGEVFTNLCPSNASLTIQDTDLGRWLGGLVTKNEPLMTQFGTGMSSVFGLPGQL